MTDTAASAEFHDETSVPGLWETARWFLRWLIAVCGTPCEIAAMNVLTRKERRDIGRWLRPVERLARRLLVAEAAQMAAGLQPGMERRNPSPRPPMRRVAFQDPEDSATWTVRFSLAARAETPPAPRSRARRAGGTRRPAPGPCDNEFERMRRLVERLEAKPDSGPNRSAAAAPDAPRPEPAPPSPPPAEFFNPRPPAERIEAVRRALENPAPRVKRLARRLARRQSAYVRRIARSCRPLPERGRFRRLKFGETSVRHAGEHALRALAAFDSS